MAEAVAPIATVPLAGRPGVPKPDESFLSSPMFQTILKSVAIYAGITYMTGPNSPLRTKPAVTFTPPGEGGVVSNGGTAAPVNAAAFSVVSLWPTGTLLDISVRLSTLSTGELDFTDTSLPSTTWEGIPYAKTKWNEIFETEFDVPTSVQNNGSLYLDIFVTKAGHSADPKGDGYDVKEMSHTRKILTRYMPQRKIRAVKNLFAAKNETEETAPVVLEVEEILPILSYYHPNITLELVMSPGVLVYSTLPDPIKAHIIMAHEGELTPEGNGYFFPPVWPNDFWLMTGSMNPINETTVRLPIRITLSPTSYTKYQIMASLEDNFSKQATTGGGEMDEVKRMLTETNPILLITTVIVTILHMLFEMLAFTSDITHWRSKKELVGVSVRTIITNCIVQLVILLYLLDNNEKTSWMILFSQGTGLAIEAWKITKAVDIAIVPSVGTLIPYKLDITDKHILNEEELKTQEYDKLAFKWVTWGTVPLLVGFTIYSAVYNEHRGWYSFVISTLTSFVYAFGFVQLIPLLIINYKLKSVAHLPMKTLTYKFFATIVDDFFSFVIKMPFLHRLACFRDDVVFLVLLYQMWIYKVDHSRTNEYGQKLTEEEAARLKAEAEAKASGLKIESKKDI